MSAQENKIKTTSICPHCGKENKVSIWLAVNSQLNPKLTERIIDDTFFDKTCKHCGNPYYIDHTVSYKDEDNNFIVSYMTDDREEMIFLEALDENIKDFEEEEICEVRIVRSRNAFREKVRAIIMGCDDRIIEMFKVWGLEQLREQGVKENMHTILCWVCDDGSLEICYFSEGDTSHVITVDFEQYAEVAEDLFDYLEENEEPCYYIDEDWAIRVIAESGL